MWRQVKKMEIMQLFITQAERKAIADRIRKEHRDDIKARKINKPSVATPRGCGKSSKMSDFVSKQGGG